MYNTPIYTHAPAFAGARVRRRKKKNYTLYLPRIARRDVPRVQLLVAPLHVVLYLLVDDVQGNTGLGRGEESSAAQNATKMYRENENHTGARAQWRALLLLVAVRPSSAARAVADSSRDSTVQCAVAGFFQRARLVRGGICDEKEEILDVRYTPNLALAMGILEGGGI